MDGHRRQAARFTAEETAELEAKSLLIVIRIQIWDTKSPHQRVTFGQENRENPDECEDGQITSLKRIVGEPPASMHIMDSWAGRRGKVLASFSDGLVEDVIKA